MTRPHQNIEPATLVSFERDKNTIVCGPTASGKTSLLIEILAEGAFTPTTPEHVYIMSPQETRESWTPEIVEKITTRYGSENTHFLFGPREIDSVLNHSDHVPENSIIVFDDFMGYLSNKEKKQKLDHWSYVVTHHRKLWTFFVTHNLFVSGILTIRRNTNNFILFNVIQNDLGAAASFIQRLVGVEFSEVCLSMLRYCVERNPHGWLRIDNRLQGRDLKGVTILSTTSPAPDRCEIFLKSTGQTAPTHLDVLRPESLTPLPSLEVVGVIRQEDGNPTSRNAPADRPADV